MAPVDPRSQTPSAVVIGLMTPHRPVLREETALTPRMEKEIAGRTERITAAFPDISSFEVIVKKSLGRNGNRGRYVLVVNLVIKGESITVQSRPDARVTLAIAQLFRATRRVLLVRMGLRPVSTDVYLRVEKKARAHRAKRSARRRRVTGALLICPPFFGGH